MKHQKAKFDRNANSPSPWMVVSSFFVQMVPVARLNCKQFRKFILL